MFDGHWTHIDTFRRTIFSLPDHRCIAKQNGECECRQRRRTKKKKMFVNRIEETELISVREFFHFRNRNRYVEEFPYRSEWFLIDWFGCELTQGAAVSRWFCCVPGPNSSTSEKIFDGKSITHRLHSTARTRNSGVSTCRFVRVEIGTHSVGITTNRCSAYAYNTRSDNTPSLFAQRRQRRRWTKYFNNAVPNALLSIHVRLIMEIVGEYKRDSKCRRKHSKHFEYFCHTRIVCMPGPCIRDEKVEIVQSTSANG